MAETQNLTLNVPEISCEHCVQSINGALGQLAGVQAVATDIPTRTVKLAFDPSAVSLATIAATLDEIGYTIAQ
ncbi:MAG TPA: cation transporter [Ktedonobacterales bacterium]|jgi:copper chaperone CopZ|nr:cation transporter [Ktedonobacterales bacterium]